MTRTFPCSVLALTLAAFATAAAATTIVPPKDLGRLARMSRSVVMARAGTDWVEDRGLPVTVTTFELVEPVGGVQPRAVFEVEQPGGVLPDRAAAVSGTAHFERGKTYLLFLARGHGRWRPQMLAYGILEESDDKALLEPLEELRELEVVARNDFEPPTVYRRAALVSHLREVLAGGAWDRRKVAAPESVIAAKLHTKPALCEFQTHSDGIPLRRFGYETGGTMSVFHTTPGQTGIADGGVSAVQQGVAAWTNHPDSVMQYLYAGSRPRNVSCSSSSDVDQGGVIFNDPCSDVVDLVGCSGTLAFGGSFYDPGSAPLYDGEPWHPVSTPFVVVNNGAQCVGETGFKEMMTHELGHTQGFGHHTDPDATMAAFIKNDGRGASLHVTDRACASYAYHTFLDVPYNHPTWPYVEAVENAGIAGSCGGGNYCPLLAVSRAEMAVWLLRAKEGGGYVPPPCTTPRFTDMPCSNAYAPWINELARRGITVGCSPTTYCPNDSVTRAQMAVFLLKTREGSGYVPPACTVPRFTDVPCSRPYAPYVNQLAAERITAGCTTTTYCPDAAVARNNMAVFVAKTFHLPLPQ